MSYLETASAVQKSAEPGGKRFQTFEDLETYQAAREFRKAMYAVTRGLPSFEKFELASQIRRAAVSLTNNLAEGHGRYHYLDQIRFVLHARGSLEELMDDLNVCEDQKYLSPSEVATRKQEGWHVLKLINGYLRYLRDSKAGDSLALKESPQSYDDGDDQEAWLANLPMQLI